MRNLGQGGGKTCGFNGGGEQVLGEEKFGV